MTLPCYNHFDHIWNKIQDIWFDLPIIEAMNRKLTVDVLSSPLFFFVLEDLIWQF